MVRVSEVDPAFAYRLELDDDSVVECASLIPSANVWINLEDGTIVPDFLVRRVTSRAERQRMNASQEMAT